MYELILLRAREREEVRAVFLNGSRANPNAPKDFFQDYDVVYFVREVEAFRQDKAWFHSFGEELIFQFPDDSVLFPLDQLRTSYACLMQFSDSNRIDLTLRPLGELDAYLKEDSETVLLLDKDGLIGELPPPSDRDYLVKRPSEAEFTDCCNEFYWVSNYAAKGLWRREMTYAQEMLNRYVRDMLLLMLSWKAGVLTGFSVSTGKCGKYLSRFLPEEDYARLLSTYACGKADEVWDALEASSSLFRDAAVFVGERLGYPFPKRWHENVTAFCGAIRALKPDAKEL